LNLASINFRSFLLFILNAHFGISILSADFLLNDTELVILRSEAFTLVNYPRKERINQ